MTKYEFITELLELFDALDELKRDNEDLRHAMQQQFDASINESKEPENSDFATLDYYALQAGRKALIDKYFYSFYGAKAKRDESGEIEVTPFEDWVKQKYNRTPDYTSKRLFLQYLEPTLRKMYEEEKAKAIEYLKDEEAEAEESSDE